MLWHQRSPLAFLFSHWLAGAPVPQAQDSGGAAGLRAAWARCAGRCECRETGHWHGSRRCGRPLQAELRGLEGWGGWTLRVWSAPTGESRTEVVCWACHLFAGTESGAGV
jgi:hypothetical protein